jgi:hypothetical protein
LFANKPSKSNYEVVISNAIGTLIDTKEFDDNVVLNIKNYSSGIYFATVRDKSNNEAKVTKKFVKN